MSEITGQIQNPVTPEAALAEVPEPSLPELPAQPPPPETAQPDGESQDETALTTEIVQLWHVHQDCQSAIKQETQQFRSLRSELGKLLYRMKSLLAKPGRNGQWSGWLSERKIPRATADRLVLKFERSLRPESSCLSESITEPTEAEIQSLLDKIAPKLRRVLRTPASAYRFLDLLSALLALDRKETEEGFIVVKPSAHMAVEQSVPAEGQVESVSVIADVLAESNTESTGASMAV